MDKYIEIIDYTDLCSTAFIRSLDSLPEVVYDDSTDKMIINMSNKDIRELFEYYLDMEIQSISSVFGRKVIIIDTCPLKTNWKRYSIGILEKEFFEKAESKYYVIDDSLLIDMKALTKLLERKWAELRKKKSVITLAYEGFDIQDIIKETISLLGENHIIRYESDFKIIGDLNLDYFGILTEDIPLYLRDHLTNVFVNNNLLI